MWAIGRNSSPIIYNGAAFCSLTTYNLRTFSRLTHVLNTTPLLVISKHIVQGLYNAQLRERWQRGYERFFSSMFRKRLDSSTQIQKNYFTTTTFKNNSMLSKLFSLQASISSWSLPRHAGPATGYAWCPRRSSPRSRAVWPSGTTWAAAILARWTFWSEPQDLDHGIEDIYI